MSLDIEKLCGWRDDKWEEAFQALKHTFIPFPIQAAPKEKLPPIWHWAKQVYGKHLPTWFQETGDCFVAGTAVLLADGSEKPIENVRVGDVVVSHLGNYCRVTRTIKKNYEGDLVTITTSGNLRSVTATPDHKFVAYPRLPYGRNGKGKQSRGSKDPSWKAVENLSTRSRVLLPVTGPQRPQAVLAVTDLLPEALIVEDLARLPKAKKSCFRQLPLDVGFGWLLGIYAAEGGIACPDHRAPHRVTFSLSRDELELADRVLVELQRVFGIEASLVRVPSKPTVIQVYCHSTVVAQLFRALCPGNVYTKRLAAAVFQAQSAFRMACIRGWLDGDGDPESPSSQKSAQVTGVTASPALASDMGRLGLSVGLANWSAARKPRGASGVAYDVRFSGAALRKLFPGRSFSRGIGNRRAVVAGGFAQPIVRYVRETVGKLHVYCLDVEQDHSFVANGYAVHNCVSMGATNAGQQLSCVNIGMFRKEQKLRLWYPPYIYGTSRVDIGNGQLGREAGSTGAWAIEAMRKRGVLFEDDEGVPKYSGKVADQWGRGVPDEFKKIASDNPVFDAAPVRDSESIRLALDNYWPCTYAIMWMYGQEAYEYKGYRVMKRGRAVGGHQVCLLYWNDDIDAAFCLNSWGKDAHKGPTSTHDEPPGGAYILRKDLERDLQQGAQCEVYALKGFEGDPSEAWFGLFGGKA